jgi:hypothetical protein
MRLKSDIDIEIKRRITRNNLQVIRFLTISGISYFKYSIKSAINESTSRGFAT